MIKKNLGFTLIEIIVAVGVFSFVVTIMGSSFAQMIKLQRRALSAQKIQENSMFVLELMAREIRVSTVQSGNMACTNPGNFGTSLAITHPVSGTISYRSSNGIVYRTEGGIETSISSQDVNFSQLYFCIKGSGLDTVQTRIGIIAQVENTTGIASDKLIFNLQTTVTSRNTSNEFQN
ncbi:MAG: prepilin-type N-terminal cleavage/methylation domain-containing protein [Candidatus Yanofskybacteria bacterium]|nr:prepilin-type N-terminal cleavage/methylation domain-containing protein [Candidatus Yanofskybacteria bacterium]